MALIIRVVKLLLLGLGNGGVGRRLQPKCGRSPERLRHILAADAVRPKSKPISIREIASVPRHPHCLQRFA